MAIEYTNISTEPLGIIDDLPIKPCMKSGFCCTKSPCGYGEMKDDKSGCIYLGEPNDLGQRDCGRYEWIKENVNGWEFYPAFGSGCCMPMFNEMRDKIIQNIKTKL